VTRLAAGIGLATIALGAVALLVGRAGSPGTGVAAFAALLAIFGVVAAIWKLLGTPGAGDSTVLRPPWTDDGALFDLAPERTDRDDTLSGESFAAVLAEAGDAARSAGTTEAGYETVRPVLRRALADALSLGESDRDAVEDAIDDGTWTGDRRAAAVLAPSIAPPPLSLRERIEAWLFPERVVRRRLQVAVQAIAEAADGAIPDVPGQNAPRSVPVVQPRVEDLQRGVDGRVQRARDPLATARGPRPPGEEVPIDVDDDTTADERSLERQDETASGEREGSPDSRDETTVGDNTSDEDSDLFVTREGSR